MKNSSGPLEEEYSVTMEGGGQLYLIMTADKRFRYCLYRIDDPQAGHGYNGDETTITNLGEPLLRMKKSTFRDSMQFVGIGSRIFMVGGCSHSGRASKKVFIYDTMSSTLTSGPALNSGKLYPYLLTLGSKLFALSHLIYSCDRKSDFMDRQPLFEMLDTNDLERGWSPLPTPRLQVSDINYVYSVKSLAAVYIGGGSGSGVVIFISGVDGKGTYAFDVDKQVWNYVSNQILPFYGHATTVPHVHSLCCAISLKSGRFSAFRFFYQGNESNHGFQVDETEIDDSDLPFPSLPSLACCRPSLTVLGSNGRMYFVMTGVDKVEPYGNLDSTRYVKIIARQFCASKLAVNEGHLLKRCSKKKKMGHGENQDGTTKLKLTDLWRICFCGGPVCDQLVHVAGVIAM